MERLITLIFLFPLLLGLSAVTTTAQSSQHLIDIRVNLTCSSIRVNLDSEYDFPIKAQVFAGTNGLTNWNLVSAIGDYTRAGARGTGSRTYQYETGQPPNTSVSFSVRVYDDENNWFLAIGEGTRDCDGEANNAPPTTTTTSSATPSFLASCNINGGIVVQPVGGTTFTINSTQIAQGTAMAISSNTNVAIATVGNVSAFGLPNNSVQLVASDGYNLIIPVTACAQTVTTTSINISAAAQAAALSCSSTPADAVRTHVVRAGENLFRIGLRYGVPFPTLATYNGIPDPTLIFVGQCIAIPPS